MFNTKWNLRHEHGIHWLVFKIILCVPQDIDMLVIGCCFVALQNGHPYVDKFMNYNCLVCFKVLLLCTTIHGLKTTPLNDGKLLRLTSLVIFIKKSSCSCFWKKLYEMKLDSIDQGIFVGESWIICLFICSFLVQYLFD